MAKRVRKSEAFVAARKDAQVRTRGQPIDMHMGVDGKMTDSPPEGPILIVDDNDEVREALGALLESAGHQVLAAADGREALAFLRRCEVPPCLVLLDLMMPGLNGWDFRAEQIRDERLAAIPVIVLSAHPLAMDAKNMGAAAVLLKPFDPETVLAAVRATLRIQR